MICLDASPIIWGVKKEGDPEERAKIMVPRAVAFMGALKGGNKQVIVPAPVVAEVLVRTDSTRFEELTNELQRRFFIAPLDFPAAAKAAELHNRYLAKLAADGQKPSGCRKCFKVDLLVAGIALTRKATRIITGDPGHFTRFLDGESISIEELPETTGDLFADA